MPATIPVIGASQYSQWAVQTPPITAGPSVRAGLKLPPVSGPVTSAPAKTVAPRTNGVIASGTRSSVATAMITKPSKPVYPISITNARVTETVGNVAPKLPTGPSNQPSSADAAMAPMHCAAMYGSTVRDGKRPTDQKPSVTAGLMCAPPR